LSNDKDFHEKPSDDWGSFPSPVNCIIAGGRNIGKTRVMKNILLRQTIYDHIVVYTPLEDTQEYDVEYVNEIPPFSFFDKSQQYNCFIIEDCDVKNDLNREQRTLLGNYYRVASHMNIDLFTITQNPFNITPTLRRVANVVILFKNNDLDMLNSLCRKFNVKSSDLKAIFDTLHLLIV